MTLSAILVALMLISLFAWLMTGFPVAFTLGGTALIFAAIGIGAGTLNADFLSLFPDRVFGVMGNELLLAIPLFVAMGVMLEKTNVAEDLLGNMARLFGRKRGGLGFAVTIVGALLAASTGIVGATVVTMGLLSLPLMQRSGYSVSLASGSIVAAGTLGQIIPPSIVLILLGDAMSTAWSEAQRDMGVVNPDPVSVGDLFAGALIPGLVLVALYLAFQAAMALWRPESSPRAVDQTEALDLAFYRQLLSALVPPIVLIVGVLGSILAGIATPTQAAAVGAVGAILLGALRAVPAGRTAARAALGGLALLALLALGGGVAGSSLMFWSGLVIALATAAAMIQVLWALWRAGLLTPMLAATVRISTMIYTILIGAALFALVFRGFGGDHMIEQVLTDLPGGVASAVLVVMLLMFVLGFFLDFIEIIFVVVPIVAPVLLMMGVDPIWLGILMALNLQTSFLTPPFGFALFYLRGVAPADVPTSAIYRGAVPFVLIQLVMLVILWTVPGLATWLPGVLS